jgi:ADP-heptose:LPS heptosyltransferase
MALQLGKQLENTGRRLLIRAVAWLLRRAGGAPPPDGDARPRRVLLLRYDGIGDMILSTGLLRAVATSHPNIVVDVLASSANAPVLRDDPHAGRILIFDKRKAWRYPLVAYRLRRARYDAVVDRLPTAPSLTAILLMLASGARHRVGVSGLGNEAYFTVLVPPPPPGADHIVEHLAALAAAFGVDPQAADFRPAIYLSSGEAAGAAAVWRAHTERGEGRRMLVNVSAAVTQRRWPDDHFVSAIRHIVAKDPRLAVIVIGAPHDVERVDQIARAARVPAVRTATIRDAFALVATADFVFTPDTSIGHAAVAFSKPAVVLYPRGNARRWGLYRGQGYELSSPEAAVSSLPPEPVFAALDRLLAEADGPEARSRRPVSGVRLPALCALPHA